MWKCTVSEKYSDYEPYVDLVRKSLRAQLCEKRSNFPAFSQGGGCTSMTKTICVDLRLSIEGKGQLQIPLSTCASRICTVIVFVTSVKSNKILKSVRVKTLVTLHSRESRRHYYGYVIIG